MAKQRDRCTDLRLRDGSESKEQTACENAHKAATCSKITGRVIDTVMVLAEPHLLR